jgi:hypothetical protein
VAENRVVRVACLAEASLAAALLQQAAASSEAALEALQPVADSQEAGLEALQQAAASSEAGLEAPQPAAVSSAVGPVAVSREAWPAAGVPAEQQVDSLVERAGELPVAEHLPAVDVPALRSVSESTASHLTALDGAREATVLFS